MVDVQFEEENQFSGGFRSRQVFGVLTTPGMVQLLGKLGVRNEKAAGYILVMVAIIAFTVSIFIFMNMFNRGSNNAGADTFRVGPPVGEL